jgi:hypothetical protein
MIAAAAAALLAVLIDSDRNGMMSLRAIAGAVQLVSPGVDCRGRSGRLWTADFQRLIFKTAT